jgi:hypothetical protein
MFVAENAYQKTAATKSQKPAKKKKKKKKKKISCARRGPAAAGLLSSLLKNAHCRVVWTIGVAKPIRRKLAETDIRRVTENPGIANNPTRAKLRIRIIYPAVLVLVATTSAVLTQLPPLLLLLRLIALLIHRLVALLMLKARVGPVQKKLKGSHTRAKKTAGSIRSHNRPY